MAGTTAKVAAACFGLGVFASVAAQTLAGQTWFIGLPCDQVSVQAVVDNNPQQIIGIACRQPDNSWQFVEITDDQLFRFRQHDYGFGLPGTGYREPYPFGPETSLRFGDWLRRSMPMHGTFLPREGIKENGGAHNARTLRQNGHRRGAAPAGRTQRP